MLWPFPHDWSEYKFCGEKKAMFNLALALSRQKRVTFLSMEREGSFSVDKFGNLEVARLPVYRIATLLSKKVRNYLKSFYGCCFITSCGDVRLHLYIRSFVKPHKLIYVSHGFTKEYALRNAIHLYGKIFMLLVGHLQEYLAWKTDDLIITLTEDEAKKMCSYVNREKVSVLSHGVDLQRYSQKRDAFTSEVRKAYGLNTGSSIVLAVGRISYENNFHNVIKVFHELKKINRESVLVIAGTTWTPPGSGNITLSGYRYLLYLKNIVSDLGIGNSVKFITNIPEKELPFIYTAADVFVQFTEGYSPLPNVILEAGAAGLPLVLTDFKARRSVLHDGYNGFFVKPSDPRLNPSLVAKKIDYILRNNDLRKIMGKRSREKVEQRFDITRIAEKYIDICKE
jgi:glycosyltransferase involved in cell wall biosynthesis